MNADEYGTALKLFSKLGIDPELDTELSRGFFILSLFYNLPSNERSYHSGSLESKFERRLNKFDIAFFPAFDEGCEDVFSIMDSLYNLLLRNNLFEDAYSFFAIFSPWIVADWSTYINLQPTKKIDGKAQITLIKLLEWREEFLPEELIFQIDPMTLLHNNSDISKYWRNVLGFKDDLFSYYWNAVFFHDCPKIEVKINGNITKTIKTYGRFFVPMTQLLEDYWDALKNRKQVEYAANPWQVRANMNHSPIESGLTTEETLYNTTVFEIKNEKATDVIRSTFYSNSRNDSELECSFLFEQFAENLSRESRVLIVNASPDLILKCMSDNRFLNLDKLYFSVPDICVAQCYSREIPQAIFIPHADINKLSDIDHVLIMSRDYPINKLDDLFSAMNVCKPSAQILAVLPRAVFESVPSTAKDIWNRQHCYIEQLLILPDDLTHSSPRRKALFYLRKTDCECLPEIILFHESYFDRSSHSLYIRKVRWRVSANEMLTGRRTILYLKKTAENKKRLPDGEKATRNRARPPYKFSEEIEICYTIIPDRKNSVAGKAYYCAIQLPGSKRKHGKRLTDTIEKGLRARTESEVFDRLETVPFNDRIAPFIIKDVLTFYSSAMDQITLKTLWFCCRDKLQKSSMYSDEAAKQLFCSEPKQLGKIHPSRAFESDFCEAMSQLFHEDPYSIPLKFWRQIDLILTTAVSEKYLRYDPLTDLLRKLSSQATEEQREVRNALTKKTLTLEEESKLLEFLFRDTKQRFGQRAARRYEAESIWLSGAIRFFTGMSLKETGALLWSDFLEIPDTGSYQFHISKQLTDDGKAAEDFKPDDRRHYRRVPVVPALANMLISRKKYLASISGIPSDKIEHLPIILGKEQYEEAENKADSLYCSPTLLDPNSDSTPSLIISGQDVVLDILANHLYSKGVNTGRAYLSSYEGLLSLYEDKVHLASCHLYSTDENEFNSPFVKILLPGIPAVLINISYRIQGFYVKKGNPKGIKGWGDLKRGDISVLNRRTGSSSRILLDGQLKRLGIPASTLQGYDRIMRSHLTMAAAIAEGEADIGIGTERVSHQIDGLEFVPLLEERYDLALRKERLNTPEVQAMLVIMASASFKNEIAHFSGNNYRDIGKIIAEV